MGSDKWVYVLSSLTGLIVLIAFGPTVETVGYFRLPLGYFRLAVGYFQMCSRES